MQGSCFNLSLGSVTDLTGLDTFHFDVIYRISGNFGTMEILAFLANDKNTPI